jgi:hypothetical protein
MSMQLVPAALVAGLPLLGGFLALKSSALIKQPSLIDELAKHLAGHTMWVAVARVNV